MIDVIPMALSHIDEVHEIEKDSFALPWSKEDLIREITENKNAYYFVAHIDGRVVGYAGMWHVVNEGHITNIAVLSRCREMGIGNLLLNRLFEKGKDLFLIGITLEVRISNLRAQRLYIKNGFKPEGFRKKYYGDTNEDAIILWKYF